MVTELSVYQRISEYAAEHGIRLDVGYVVWVVQGDTVKPSGLPGDYERVAFADLGAATAFAEKHDPTVRVFVTGPVNKQCMEILPRRK